MSSLLAWPGLAWPPSPPQVPLKLSRSRHRRSLSSVRCSISSEESPPTAKREKGQSLSAQDLLRDDEDDGDGNKSERPSERFMVVGSGQFECTGCGYIYDPKTGDPEYPVSAGTMFKELPADWCCPVCGADPKMFQSKAKVRRGGGGERERERERERLCGMLFVARLKGASL